MSCEFFCLIFHLFPITKEFNSFWDTYTMHWQALFMVMEKNMLWFCSFYFSLFCFLTFPRISCRIGQCHEPHGRKKHSHFETVCITKEKYLWSKLCLGIMVALTTKVGLLLLKQMKCTSQDSCRAGSPSGWIGNEEATGASLVEHHRWTAVGQGVFSILWNLILWLWDWELFEAWFSVSSTNFCCKWSAAIIQSASKSTNSSVATSDFMFFSLPNGSATCAWKLHLVHWRRQRCSDR